ncbi:G5 domain-containing protein [Microbacterium sp. P07]|uniref:G5 domain-containing protein n=1 Tax=Microbacterium sp. P07 TaxID=3366952 RepID=UPI0037464601
MSREGVTLIDPLAGDAPAIAKRVPVWAWIGIAVVTIVALFLFRPLLALVALVILVTAIVGLTRGTPTWLRLRTRNIAIGAIAASAAVLLVSAGVSAAVPGASDQGLVTEAVSGPESASPIASPTRSATPTPTQTPTPTPVVTTREEVVREAIPFERTNADDPNRPRGQNAVTTAGMDGERTLTYTVTLTDGVETGRAVASDVVSRPPTTEVTSVGVYDAPKPAEPAPAPPQSGGGCHGSYSGACVPVGVSDVDCASGKGDGPEYVGGPIRVVGPDVYDLDGNDNDGIACE